MKKSKIIFVVTALILTITLSLTITAQTGMVCSIPEGTLPQVTENNFPDEFSRSEESTYLTFPEWYIVYSSDEYADFISTNKPSEFPYFAGISQYWQTYRCINTYTSKNYPFNSGNQLMLGVIGMSYSIEFGARGLYEGTVGRVFELTSPHYKTEEDLYGEKVATEYGEFLHMIPWFEFPFFEKLTGLWQEVPIFGKNPLRKLERRLVLSTEYLIKGSYGFVLKRATHSVLGVADLTIKLQVNTVSEEFLQAHEEVTVVTEDDSGVILNLPRYEVFTQLIPPLLSSGSKISSIAGNDEIFATILVDTSWVNETTSTTMFEMEYLTQPARRRVGLRIPVAQLHEVLPALEKDGAQLEHLYDY